MRGMNKILQYIDKQYEKITWLCAALGLVCIFFGGRYLTFILLLYLTVNAVKHRTSMKKKVQSMSMKEKLTHVICFLCLISLLTAIMIYSSDYMNSIGVPVWLKYIYIFIVMNIASIGYVIVISRKKS